MSNSHSLEVSKAFQRYPEAQNEHNMQFGAVADIYMHNKKCFWNKSPSLSLIQYNNSFKAFRGLRDFHTKYDTVGLIELSR